MGNRLCGWGLALALAALVGCGPVQTKVVAQPASPGQASGASAGTSPTTQPATSANRSTAGGCAHHTALLISVPDGNSGDRKEYCLYVLNLFNATLDWFQTRTTEPKLVALVDRVKTAHFMQDEPHTIASERVSRDGVLLFLLFERETGAQATFGQVGEIEVTLRYGEADHAVELSASRYQEAVHLSKVPEGLELGVELRVDIKVTKDAVALAADDRFSWFRPKDGWAVDYQVLGAAVRCKDFEFNECGALSFVPATVRAQYRWYKEDGTAYLFGGITIGASLGDRPDEVDDAGEATEERGVGVQGIVGALSVDLSGVELGFGAMFVFDEPDDGSERLVPLFIVNVSEAVLRRFGAAPTFPKSVLGAE